MAESISLTGIERTFGEDEIIVSKTDLKGRVTYANDIFLEIADFSEEEVLGQPHNIIRHPDMPRCVFKLLWNTLQAGEEIFAYVINRAKGGDHYWVLAHVTPTVSASGDIIGYHSNRRVPNRAAIPKVKDLYRKLRDEENLHANDRVGMESSTEMLLELLGGMGLSYSEFVFALENGE